MTGSPITKLMITLSDIDSVQKIDKNRAWSPIMSNDIDESKAVFIGFYAGDSPPIGDELEYGLYPDEVFWVYKTDYIIQDLMNDTVTPQELFRELQDEQPNIEIAGLCKYVNM